MIKKKVSFGPSCDSKLTLNIFLKEQVHFRRYLSTSVQGASKNLQIVKLNQKKKKH